MKHVSGLDTIRFFCALWVFFGHGFQPPMTNPFVEGTQLYWIFRGLYGNAWSGPAAVIVFFVISGFCIHYPNANPKDRLQSMSFIMRRLLRIGLPVAIAIPIAASQGIGLALFERSILWSLLAEAIYYFLYPLLRAIWSRRNDWSLMIALSFVAAALVAASNPSAGDFPSYGPLFNWVLGLPCWLLGCRLADRVYRGGGAPSGEARIWTFRLAIFALAGLCSVLRFHSPIGYPWTLPRFSIAVYYWLVHEIAYRRTVLAPRPIESAGAWSFSLYLLHATIANTVSWRLNLDKNNIFDWSVLLALTFVGVYFFYLLVERPSHRIARAVATMFVGKTAAHRLG